MGCFCHFCPCQELYPTLTEEDIKRGSRKSELDELRGGYIPEKSFMLLKCGNLSGGDFTRQPLMLKHIRENFPYRRSLTEHQLLEGMKKGNLFGYVQCDIEVPKKLRTEFDKFPPTFKNTLVSKSDIGDLMKNYDEEEGKMSQPRKLLTSSFKSQNGTLITPLLLLYLQLCLFVTKTHRFVE